VAISFLLESVKIGEASQPWCKPIGRHIGHERQAQLGLFCWWRIMDGCRKTEGNELSNWRSSSAPYTSRTGRAAHKLSKSCQMLNFTFPKTRSHQHPCEARPAQSGITLSSFLREPSWMALKSSKFSPNFRPASQNLSIFRFLSTSDVGNDGSRGGLH